MKSLIRHRGLGSSIANCSVFRSAEPAIADENYSDLVIGLNDDAIDPVERRRHPRSVAVLKAAKLVCGREHLCLIRNISSTGMMADMLHPPCEGTELTVLLTDHLPLRGNVVWVRGETLGIRFDQEIDVTSLLCGLVRAPEERRARLPRFDVDAWARLRVGARVFSVRLCNISQGGARMRIHGLESPGVAVLSLNGLRAIDGVVRWCDGTRAGISFNQPLGPRELMHWLESIPAVPGEAPAC